GRRSYERSYFEEEYRRQYGRTYLEDFEAIKSAGRRRVSVIRRLLGGRGGRLLDVGCAYGPFLAAAREAGFQAEGLDVSAPAVEHVREVLKIPCRVGDFESGEEPWPPGSFDAVSMWYVAEHFREPGLALERAARLLRPGGVLALATPNGAGISGRRDREAFLRSSPADHRTIWSPRAGRRLMRRYGLRPAVTVITGHHPERFPWPGGVSRESASPGRRSLLALVGLASRTLGLGDTFELYAVRTEAQK
ncbi:MAG: class I SAM-dependent methyltransferase, partial [Spirochaetales bacterium]|nr:class I SAM-dependent methyltransferase [Spirochaetales bacterium]